MNKEILWQTVIETLKINLSPANFSTWFPQTFILKIKKVNNQHQIVEIACPSTFVKNTIEDRYFGQIKEIIDSATGQKSNLIFSIKQADQTKTTANPPLFQSTPAPVSTVNHNNQGLNPRFVFESFIVGSSNNFAHAAARGIVTNPGKAYNPFFIYGGVGVGKTHLMQAIGHGISQHFPDHKIIYASAETFTNELVASLQNKTTPKFKKKYREVDVLLIDDIQFISGKEYSQEEFFHTFNSLYMNGRQIVLTADRRPEEISRLEDRLVSRFLGGLTVDIQAPDYEMRLAILKQKCRQKQKEVSGEVLDFIATQVESNARELEGVLVQILTLTETNRADLDLDYVRKFFGVKKKQRSLKITPEKIVSLIAKESGFKIKEITGLSRKAPLVKARHLAMYLLRNDLELPLTKIGEIFGDRDHTTVMHATDKIQRLFTSNQNLRSEVVNLRNNLFKQ
ncbi:MAG: chromosomal replication initiator protein DnaA [Candidatus Pacebacteria bacterium]|nr:chromosomal replication initiator protein DnaA [Candidatus Paceibacterota bacterium]